MASRFPLLFLVIYLILPLPMSSSFSPQAQEPPRQALAAHAGLASSNHARLASEKVAIIGSGNWGTAIARIVGANTRAATAPVKMWVFEEDIDGRPLSEIINEKHENVKYLKGIPLPKNIVAVPSLQEACKDATILIFVTPHQFLPKLLPAIKASMNPNAHAISLIKGLDFTPAGIQLISRTISDGLQVPCSVLMGANVANEVALDEFCEATIGCTNSDHAKSLHALFNTDTFSINVVSDVAGVELSGALKNVVALGAGFCDGLGYGGNTKAAIIRIGLEEIRRFSKKFFDSVEDKTFFESCGIADLITTCYGGRNRMCSEAFVKEGKMWGELEEELLGGQKLQGTVTSMELNSVMEKYKCKDEFPFFDCVYNIAFKGLSPDSVTKLKGEKRLVPSKDALQTQ